MTEHGVMEVRRIPPFTTQGGRVEEYHIALAVGNPENIWVKNNQNILERIDIFCQIFHCSARVPIDWLALSK